MRFHPTVIFAVLPLMLSAASWSAELETGQDAYNSGDYQTALTEWQPLAEAGHAGAQFGMGLLYANGFGVAFDNEQALKWYQLAAGQAHAEAQCSIAIMYANGWGVPQSDEKAFEWYSLAAEQGITKAQTSLGRMYMHGFGIDESKVQAHKWFAIAAKLGDTSANQKRDELAEKLSAEELTESELLAGTWMASHQNLHASH